ncbi:MAG: hypothetical protein IPI67_06825 [Myxococcales bacterium]|nr:hypothetical protein [Myxococcales bacterium]
MDDFSALAPGERAVFAALERRGVRFMLVGLSAAVLQGANTGTRDIDIWFEDLSDPRIGGKRATGRSKDLAVLPALEEALAAIASVDESV